ncbi:hypothetical protein IAT38_006560 [Cryptococcus sp. DSM 104549]
MPAIPTTSSVPYTFAPARLHTSHAAHPPTLLRLRAPNAVPSDTAVVSCNMAGPSAPPRTVPRGLAMTLALGQGQTGGAAMLGFADVRDGGTGVGPVGAGEMVGVGASVGGGEGSLDDGGEAARRRKRKRRSRGGDDADVASGERSVRRRGECRDKRTVERCRPPPSWLVSTVPAVHPPPPPTTPPSPWRGSRDRSKAKPQPRPTVTDAASLQARQPQGNPAGSGNDRRRPQSETSAVAEQEPQSWSMGRANSWGGALGDPSTWAVRTRHDDGTRLGGREGGAGVMFGTGVGGWEELGRRRASEPVGLVSAVSTGGAVRWGGVEIASGSSSGSGLGVGASFRLSGSVSGGAGESHWGSLSVGGGDGGRRQSMVESVGSEWNNDGWSGDADVASDPWTDTFSFAAQVPSAPGSSHMSWDSSVGSVCDAEREMRGMVEEHRRASVHFLDPFAVAAPAPPASVPIPAPPAHSPSQPQELGGHVPPARRGWEHFTAPFAAQVHPPPSFFALGAGPSPTSGGYATLHPHHQPHSYPHLHLPPHPEPHPHSLPQPFSFPSTSLPLHVPHVPHLPQATPSSRTTSGHNPTPNIVDNPAPASAPNPNHNGLLPPSLLSRAHSPTSTSTGPSSSISTPEDPAAHAAQGTFCPVNMSDLLFAGNLPGEESFEKAFGMGWLRGVPGSASVGTGVGVGGR